MEEQLTENRGRVLLVGEPMGIFIAAEEGELADVSVFTSSVAGAEYNVAMGLTRLGHEARYFTKLGSDPFGEKILKAMKKNGINTDLVTTEEDKLTGFMIKSQVANGDPKIFYYRKNSAASALCAHDIDKLDMYGVNWVHITGITAAISETALSAVKRLIKRAKALEITISFDPNLRPQLWESEKKMVTTLNALAEEADLVLPGIGEGKILAGTEKPEEIAGFYHNMGVRNVVVKLGAKGSYYSEKGGESGTVDGFKVNKIVDTVGAGDGFAAGVISALCEGKSLKEAACRGNVIGAIQITNKSDNDGLPTREELERVIKNGEV